MNLTKKNKKVLNIALENWTPEKVSVFLQYPLVIVKKYNRQLKNSCKPAKENAVIIEYFKEKDGVFVNKTAKILDKFDLSEYKLKSILQKHGLNLKPVGKSKKTICNSDYKKIAELKNQGLKLRHIVKETGFSKQKVEYILRKNVEKQQENK